MPQKLILVVAISLLSHIQLQATDSEKIDIQTQKNSLTIKISNDFKGFIELQFLDLSGQIIYAEIVYKSTPYFEYNISTRNFITGDYDLCILANKKVYKQEVRIPCPKQSS